MVRVVMVGVVVGWGWFGGGLGVVWWWFEGDVRVVRVVLGWYGVLHPVWTYTYLFTTCVCINVIFVCYTHDIYS